MLNLKAETEAILACLYDAYGVDGKDLVGPSRMHPVNEARLVGYLLARRRGMSYPRIGRLFNRDHSTVMVGVKAAERLMSTDVHVAALVLRYCGERAQYDADTLELIRAFNVQSTGITRGVPSVPLVLPSPSGVVSNGSGSDSSLLSSDQDIRKSARVRSKPKTAIPADFDETVRPAIVLWAREKHRRDPAWANERLDLMKGKCEAKGYTNKDWIAAARVWLEKDILDEARYGKPPGAVEHAQRQADDARRRPELALFKPPADPKPSERLTPAEIDAAARRATGRGTL